MRTLRNMIDFLKGKMDKVIEDIKRMPKVNPRGVNEVSEDSIATISIEEIQRILKEDINTVYDALGCSGETKEGETQSSERGALRQGRQENQPLKGRILWEEPKVT